jgi:hypothetical protein
MSITYWFVCARACMRISTCSLANPARNAYAPYCDGHLGFSVFATFFGIINGAIFGEIVIEYKTRVLIFCTTSARYHRTCHRNTFLICQICFSVCSPFNTIYFNIILSLEQSVLFFYISVCRVFSASLRCNITFRNIQFL